MTPRRAGRALLLLPVLALAAACGGSSGAAPGPRLHPAAEPARAPALSATPAGRVVDVGPGPEGVVVTDEGRAVVALRKPAGVALVDLTAAGPVVRRTIALASSPRHLQLTSGASPLVLTPLEGTDELLLVDPISGETVRDVTHLPRQPHDAAQASTGVVAVTDELGGGMWFVPAGSGTPTHVGGPVQPGGVAAAGPFALAADVRGLGVWTYDTRTLRLVAHEALGQGLTHTVAMGGDRVAVADTDGGATFVVRVDSTGAHRLQRLPEPGGRPYGMAVDPRRGRLLITLTAANELLVYDLAAPGAVVARVPTVRQPNSVAVDPRTGDAVVTGTAAGTLQVIPASALR